MQSAARFTLLIVLPLAFLLALGGCQTQPEAPVEEGPPLFFPLPPDPPRVQFLTWYTGADQLEPKESSPFADFILGEKPKPRPRLRKPFGLAARDGVLYVCDTKAFCISTLDFRKKKFGVFGTTGMGRVRKPVNIAVDELGYKFVADAARNEILIYGPDNEFVRGLEVPGDPCRVVDVAVHGNEVYALDNLGPSIVVFDRATGALVRSFGKRGSEPGDLGMPSGLTIDPEGYLYVCDPLDGRIQKLTREGESVWDKGGPGYVLGTFGRPRGIRAGPDGVLYITDAATSIVQMWNGDGQVLMHFGGPGGTPGSMILPSSVALDASSLEWFREYFHPDFTGDYLIFSANQFGPHLINVYALGAFPEGYDFSGSEFRTILPIPVDPDEVGPMTEPEEGSDPARGSGTAAGGGLDAGGTP